MKRNHEFLSRPTDRVNYKLSAANYGSQAQ